jgi:ABC-type transporter Mla maintaining outer membrane lipid asymmetry ATPase subunit MlaF
MEIEQDEFEKNQFVEQVPKLIADADSTQYKVILKALEGKSMAVEGPPGTGKSQTITNIIGGLIVKNKKVLFAADKLAALEVVKQRLNHKNLGDYILELHSPTKFKKPFLLFCNSIF